MNRIIKRWQKRRKLVPRTPSLAAGETIVVSRPGAALHVERIELSNVAVKGLTTNLNSIGKPTDRPGPALEQGG